MTPLVASKSICATCIEIEIVVVAEDLTAASGTAAEMISVETQTDPHPHHRDKPVTAQAKTATFYVSDSSSDDDEADDSIDVMVGLTTTETQTEESSLIAEYQLREETRPPRPLPECLAILKSSVGMTLSWVS